MGRMSADPRVTRSLQSVVTVYSTDEQALKDPELPVNSFLGQPEFPVNSLEWIHFGGYVNLQRNPHNFAS
jgi:hypothetical protein